MTQTASSPLTDSLPFNTKESAIVADIITTIHDDCGHIGDGPMTLLRSADGSRGFSVEADYMDDESGGDTLWFIFDYVTGEVWDSADTKAEAMLSAQKAIVYGYGKPYAKSDYLFSDSE